MAFPLTDEQKVAVYDRGGELLISAAAGSGKTRVLVERLLDRVTREKIDIDRFLVITFTRAAANELRSRVAAELSSRLAEDPSNSWLRRQSTLVYKAPISTIHALCGDLLREFSHLIDLDPDLRLLDEGETALLRARVLEDLIEERYESIEEDGDFALLLDTLSAGRDDSRLFQIASDLHLKLQAYPDPMAWLEEMEKGYDPPEGAAPEDTPWGQLLLDEVREKAAYWSGVLRRTADLCDANPGLEANYKVSVLDAAEQFELLSRAAGEGWDAVHVRKGMCFLAAGRKRMDKTLPEVEQVKRIRSEAKEALEGLLSLFGQSGEEAMADLRAVYPAVRGLFRLVRDLDEALIGEKLRRGVLEFNDLEHLAVKLLRNEDVAAILTERFAEVMVDEYQDTNEVQNTIFDAISGGGKKLFLVGDVKQSIYRFRLADPTIFLRKYSRLPSVEQAEEGEARKSVLTRNFRARPQVLQAVNDLFRAIMSPRLGGLEYSEDQALHPGGEFCAAEDGCWDTELDVLMTDTGEEEQEEQAPKDLIEARFVAGRLKRMLAEGFQVSGEGGLRSVRAGDMAVLMRSPRSVTHHYARAFREAGLSWQADGSGDLLESVEVQVALALLRIVDDPRQDVPLIAALRSPVWAMSADRLAQLRAASPGTDFYTVLTCGAERGEGDCAAFLEELETLRLEATDRPVHEFLWLLYGRTNLLGIFSAMDGGAERRADLLLLCEYARSFEASGHKGLYRFLNYLQRLQESGRGLAGPTSAKEEGAVTLLSIHGAKGLEFPVVVVAGLDRRFNRTDLYAPLLFDAELGVGAKRLVAERGLEYPTFVRTAISRKLDREMLAEEMRLLYVAMTRAKDKLILTCTLKGGEKKLAKLQPWAAFPVVPEALERCQSVGEWILLHALSRPDADQLHRLLPRGSCFAVGLESHWDIRLYEQREGDGWWSGADKISDTLTLPEEVTKNYGWRYPQTAATETPSKLTATQLKGREVDREISEQAPPAPQPMTFRRPRFLQEDAGLTAAEKGTAIHLAMQYLDLQVEKDLDGIGRELDRMERMQLLTPEQRQAVPAEKLLEFFHSDIGREVLRVPRLEREFKFSILEQARRYFPEVDEKERILFQGVIDCWFEDAEGNVTVLDFKSDRRPDPASYVPQVRSYARALERMTGKKVTRRLLYFFSDGSVHEV